MIDPADRPNQATKSKPNRPERSRSEANLQAAVTAICRAGDIAVRERKLRQMDDGLQYKSVTILSHDKELIANAVEELAAAFKLHTKRNADAALRSEIINALKTLKQDADNFIDHLRGLKPDARKALNNSLNGPSFQIKSYGGAVVSGRTQEDIDLQQIPENTLINLLKFYGDRAELAAKRFPGAKGGRGKKPFQMEHGSPKGQLVVQLMDLMFPQELITQDKICMNPSGTPAGSLHKVAVAVATYADEAITKDRGFETQVERAANLHVERQRLMRKAIRRARKRDRLFALGLLDQKLAAKFAMKDLEHARMLRLVGHQLRTL